MRQARPVGALVAVLVLLGTLVTVAGSASPPRFTATSLTPDSTYAGAKSVSGSLAETDPALLGRTDSGPVNVLIKYDYDATASYGGGVARLEATSPTVTGKKLNENDAAVRAYEAHTGDVSSEISAAVTKAVPSAEIRESFQTVYGGVAAQVPADKVADLLTVDGVVAVQEDSLEQPQTDVTPEFTGATQVWHSLSGPTNAASTVVIGVIDSGIWPEHPSFANHGLPAPPGGPHACEFGDGSDVSHLGPKFACNGKLVGAYSFLDTYLSQFDALPGEYCNNATATCSARDSDGHGSHAASVAAGDLVESAPIFGIERGPISGIAPGARLITYRVCLDAGCFGSDAVAAVQQAILDDVDVLNYSLSGGASPYTDPVELAFLDAFNAGISVNASAGNDGPDAGTADHGGPWVTTVGASTASRAHTSLLRLHASNGDTFETPGATITPGIHPAPVVLAATLPGGDALCVNRLPAGSAAGKIVACQRGPNRIIKGLNVKNAGGVGLLLYNPIKQDTLTDNHWLPAIHVDGPGDALTTFISGHAGVTATWDEGVKTERQGDVLAPFSSRGPLGDFVKPDITAPGVQILGAHTPTPVSPVVGPAGELFQATSGTSMASPHAAGASALIKAAHPSWTPAMIKSALMTSAQPVVKDDGMTPASPFEAGSGALRVNRAVSPTLVFDESYADFVASATDPLSRVELNLASVNAPTMTGTITTKRTAINVTDREQELAIWVEAPEGATITVTDRAPNHFSRGHDRDDDRRGDRSIRLKRNEKTDIWITISGPELVNGQYFGRITLDPERAGYNAVSIPVAFQKRQGAVTLTHDCTPTTFAKRTESAHCAARVANLGSVEADVDLAVTNLDRRRGLDFTNVTAPAQSIRRDDGVRWSGALTPALPAQIVSITPGGSPGGYVPLSGFGISPIAGVGDDTITNFDVPPFMYGGEQYTRIGVVSNGYLVLGGGTTADLVFTPQTFPSPARPNNTVAPFWTDLDPSTAGAIRIGALADGPNAWIVVDWAGVRNFSNTTIHSFEVWLKVGTTAASEEVTFAYGIAGAGDPGSGVNYGAENRDGTSGTNITPAPANGSDYRINTSPPAAGGTATVGYDASSRRAGTYKSVAAMTSNVTPGTTQVVQTLTVTP